MNLIDSGSAANQNIAAGFVAVATIAPPAGGAGQFLLVIRATGLNAAHDLRERETQGATSIDYPAGANGQAAEEVEVEVTLSAGEAAIAVSLHDQAGLSTAASWAWFLYGEQFSPGAGEVSSPGPSGGMTLQEARLRIRAAARDAAGTDSEYSDADVDYALQTVGERFCRVTGCNRQLSTIALAQGDPSVDVSGLPAGFRPERILSAYLVGSPLPLRRPGWEELQRRQVCEAASGRPCDFAFEGTAAAAAVYPTPDAAYTLKLAWWAPFTGWAAGCDDATAATIVLNCPRDYLLQWLAWGPPAEMQKTEPSKKYASESWQQYLLVEKQLAGAGGLGAAVIQRRRAPW